MSPSTAPLFCESVLEACRDVVRTLGGSKKVGHMLWPDKSVDAAARLVDDCCNPARRERFDPEQLLWLARQGREANCHSLMHYLADAAGYERPRPLTPKDEMASLVEALERSGREQRAIAERIERLIGNAGRMAT